MTLYLTLNGTANAVLGAWFALIGGLPTAAQVGLTAVPVTLFALLVFRFASDQEGIRYAKEQIKGHLLELWLYKDDPAVLLRAQARVALHSLAYLGYSLVPLAVMLAPVALVVIQLEARFAWRPLAVGESAILTVTLDETSLRPPGAGNRDRQSAAAGIPALQDPSQEPPSLTGAGFAVETPPLRIAERAQILWRIRAQTAGEHLARIRAAGATVERRILAGDAGAALSPPVYRAGDWRIIGYPAEPPLPAASSIAAVELNYPRARAEFLGLSSASWLLFGVTLVLGFALRGLFRVTF